MNDFNQQKILIMLIEKNIKDYKTFKKKLYLDKYICKDELINLFELSFNYLDYFEKHNYLKKLVSEIDLSSYSLFDIKSLRSWLLINKKKIMFNIDLLFFLGLIEKELDLTSTAISTFNKVLEIKNDHIDSIRQLAFISLKKNRINEGLKRLQSIIKIDPSNWISWFDIATALKDNGNNKYALIYMKEAYDRNKENALIIANIALLELYEYNYIKAQKYLDKCFAIDIFNERGLYTQALLYKKIGEFKKAYEYNKKLIERNPEYSESRFNLALCALSLGDYKEGFAGFEQRWIYNEKVSNFKLPTISRPQWKGESVYGSSTLAVLNENGFRNIIQFSRFIPLLLKYFRKIEWVVPKNMYELMKDNYACKNIVIHKSIKSLNKNYIDYEIPILSLGLALKLSLDNLYAPKVYIKANDHLISKFQNKLSNDKNLKIGITWIGKDLPNSKQLSSVNVKYYSIFNEYKNITLINLQKGHLNKDLPMENCYDLIKDCNNFNDTAGLISTLDIVISVDTAVAHLSAAMGKTTYLLNKLSSDWRWIEGKDATSWYPTMKIFNQTKLGTWDDVFTNIRKEIKKQLK